MIFARRCPTFLAYSKHLTGALGEEDYCHRPGVRVSAELLAGDAVVSVTTLTVPFSCEVFMIPERELQLPVRSLSLSETDRPEFFEHMLEMLLLGKRGAQDAAAQLIQAPDENCAASVYRALAGVALKDEQKSESEIAEAAKALETLSPHMVLGCCEALTDFRNRTPEVNDFLEGRLEINSELVDTGRDQERIAATLCEYFLARSPSAVISLLQVWIEKGKLEPIDLLYQTLARNEDRRRKRLKTSPMSAEELAQCLENLGNQPFRRIVFTCQGLQKVD